jgi:hypothetical protein
VAFDQAAIDALDKAIVSGVLSVSYGGRTITYRSTADLIKARELAILETAPKRSNTGYISRARRGT